MSKEGWFWGKGWHKLRRAGLDGDTCVAPTLFSTKSLFIAALLATVNLESLSQMTLMVNPRRLWPLWCRHKKRMRWLSASFASLIGQTIDWITAVDWWSSNHGRTFTLLFFSIKKKGIFSYHNFDVTVNNNKLLLFIYFIYIDN